MAVFNATITDSLGASATGSATLSAPHSGTTTVQRRSFYGHRLSFGDYSINSIPDYTLASFGQPVTLATKFHILKNCNLVSIRFLKAPLMAGTYTVAVWRDTTTTPLATQDVVLVSDSGGWIEVVLTTPVALTASDTVPYIIGYFNPNGQIVRSHDVFGPQDTVEHPFWVKQAISLSDPAGSAYQVGSVLTYPIADNTDVHWRPDTYYIDPVVTWPSTDAVYTGGLEYIQRFNSFAGYTKFPLGAWAALPASVATFKSYGINVMVAPYSGDLAAQMTAIKTNNVDVVPDIAINDLSTLAAMEADTAYTSHVRAILTRDEPDLVGPYTSPADLQAWHTELRKRCPGKLLMFNLGLAVVKNKGFAYVAPAGTTIKDLNDLWKQYAHITDITTCDFYMEYPPNVASGEFNLWCNPRIIGRLQDLSDYTRPAWGYVCTTGLPGALPIPATIYSSAWALLIGGARGIVFFDTQFDGGGNFLTDNSMATYPAMATQVTSLCTLIQSLAAPLLAAPAAITVSVTTNTYVGTPYAAEFNVPIHYTIRQAGGNTYLFAQSIRPGSPTGTFTVAAAANKVITVINESRTITANSSGVWTDAFTANYQVHLYQWT